MDKTLKRGWRARIVEHWTPLFPEETEVTALTAEEFAEACEWPALRAAGIVAEHEHPLELGGLRLSTIFPRHLLRVRDDGRLVPISCEDAVTLVRIALAQERRGAGVDATAVSVHETAPVTNGSGGADGDTGDGEDDSVDDSVDDEPVNGARRWFPFRRRD